MVEALVEALVEAWASGRSVQANFTSVMLAVKLVILLAVNALKPTKKKFFLKDLFGYVY